MHKSKRQADTAAPPPPPLQNHIVACSPTFSHRLPHVFSEPEQYQPDRFAPPREEDKPLPFSYLGFGGGRHGCMVGRAPGRRRGAPAPARILCVRPRLPMLHTTLPPHLVPGLSACPTFPPAGPELCVPADQDHLERVAA